MTDVKQNNLWLDRKQRLQDAEKNVCWDIIIIGGGITGAGILKLASQLGIKALLLEQYDFAWGSSSRSSKMVHGGLRYMAEGQLRLTIESVRERQRLLAEAPELISQQSFVMSHYKKQFPWPWLFNYLLAIYDFFAGQKQRKYWLDRQFHYLVPGIENKSSRGGTQFVDALTDDARLVQRLIQESLQLGGQAINYAKVTGLAYDDEKVSGVAVQADSVLLNLTSKVVINATGAWVNQGFEQQRQRPNVSSKNLRIRPLRGSHLIVASWRLPVASAISVLHPKDKRPVQIFPWQNVTVIGTTDVEHGDDLAKEPKISQAEFDYLLACVAHQFPNSQLTESDVISTFSGVRPIVVKQQSKRRRKPSKEKRAHSIWQQAGLLTVAGGKLTTFRVIAQEVIHLLAAELGLSKQVLAEHDEAIFEQVNTCNSSKLPSYSFNRLQGCYGGLTSLFLRQSASDMLVPVSYSQHLWAELLWAVKHEQVVHLDDLLLRRTRLGNVLPEGGIMLMPQIKKICLHLLGWSQQQWHNEVERYQHIWRNHYSLPIKAAGNE